MNKTVGIVLGAVLGVVLLAVMFFFYGIGIQNEEVQARNRVEAQQKNVETHHDAMWKIVRCVTA